MRPIEINDRRVLFSFEGNSGYGNTGNEEYRLDKQERHQEMTLLKVSIHIVS